MKKKLFLTAFIALCMQLSIGQTTPQTQSQPVKTATPPPKRWRTAVPVDTVKNTDFSLNGQYQFLLSRSRSINGYKLVNPARLAEVWKSALDTLVKERTALAKSNAIIAAQTDTIRTLRSEVKGNETEVLGANAKVDEISFLGMSVSKGTYSIVVWSIILILAIALFIVIGRSAKSVLEAKHRTQLYDEITAEYQNYKAKSSEKERKLARELQDERNIVEELRNSGRN